MDRLPIDPATGPLDAVVPVPGSKSIANRAIVCAVLAEGPSTIEHVPDGDDSRLLIEACSAMGASIFVDGGTVVVERGIDRSTSGAVLVDAGLGGTTSRFLTAIAALRTGPVTVSGGEALRRRPMAGLHDALRRIGATLEWQGEPGTLPVTISGGPVPGGEVEVSAGTSSQFASALLLAAPAMRDGLRLVVPSPRVSAGYLDMSVAVARDFGASVDVADDVLVVRPGGYRGRRYEVESDASSASFAFAAAALAGGKVVVPGMARVELQPERRFADVLVRMGCEVESLGSDLAVSRRRDAPLRGVDVDMAEMSDAVPALAVVATRAVGPTRIRGVGFIRGKESNRIDGLARELRKAGAGVDVEPDGFVVVPGSAREAVIDSLDDHRIAMAFGVLGLVGGPLTVADPGVVAKLARILGRAAWTLLDIVTPEIERIHAAAVSRGDRTYRDPRSGLTVMTSLAHLDRGYCCESGCRHCPYGDHRVK